MTDQQDSTTLDAPLDIDPGSQEFLSNPWPALRRIAEHDPMFWSDNLRGWLVTRHEDVKWAYSTPLLSANRIGFYLTMLPPGAAERYPTLLKYHGMTIAFQDNPDHLRIRTLMMKAFTKGAIERLFPVIEQLSESTLDIAEAKGEFDFVSELSHILPTRAIQHILGVSGEVEQQFFEDAASIIYATAKLAPSEDDMARANLGLERVNAIFLELIKAREEKPYDDFLSALVRARNDGDRLNHDELLAACLGIVEAGADSTGHMIGSAIVELVRRPDLRATLLSSVENGYKVVDELMRFPGLVRGFHRAVPAPLERHGKQLEAGQMVFIMNCAANVDPAVFEDPYDLRPGRDTRQSMAFGMGIHNCLGVMLARAELVAFLRAAFSRFDIELLEKAPPFKDIFVLRAYASLKVRFRPRVSRAVA